MHSRHLRYTEANSYGGIAILEPYPLLRLRAYVSMNDRPAYAARLVIYSLYIHVLNLSNCNPALLSLPDGFSVGYFRLVTSLVFPFSRQTQGHAHSSTHLFTTSAPLARLNHRPIIPFSMALNVLVN